MVHHRDRIANPETTPEPGVLGGIRKLDGIRVYVARCFDNYTVALRPGVAGEQLAHNPKSLNDRLRRPYDSYKIPVGSSNRSRLSPARRSRGG